MLRSISFPAPSVITLSVKLCPLSYTFYLSNSSIHPSIHLTSPFPRLPAASLAPSPSSSMARCFVGHRFPSIALLPLLLLLLRAVSSAVQSCAPMHTLISSLTSTTRRPFFTPQIISTTGPGERPPATPPTPHSTY